MAEFLGVLQALGIECRFGGFALFRELFLGYLGGFVNLESMQHAVNVPFSASLLFPVQSAFGGHVV